MNGEPRIRIIVVGIGGQGVVFASKVVGEAALQAGLNVVISEVHGMAQRGGIVTSQICIGDIHGPLIADGEADLILAFEPVEAYRIIQKANKDTTIIANSEQIKPLSASFGEVEYPDSDMVIQAINEVTENLLVIDGSSIAAEFTSHVVMNSVLLGALAGTGRLPLDPESLRAHLLKRVPPKTTDMNAKAFDAGMKAVQ